MKPVRPMIVILVGCCASAAACGDDAGQGTADATDANVVDTHDAGTGTAADVTTDSASAPDTDAVVDADVDAPVEVVIPGAPDCGDGLLVTREGTKGDVSFRLDRCMPMICGGGCPVSSPQLIITYAGHVDVATSDRIDYAKTHHNWTDSLVGTLPDRRLLWRVEFDFEDGLVEKHVLAIEALDGSPILEETTIEIAPHG